MVSRDATEGLDISSTEESHADGEVKGFGCESTSLLFCSSGLGLLNPAGPWRRYKASRFWVLGLREFRQELLFILEDTTLGRLVQAGSGCNMLELWGSRCRVQVFKGSMRKVLQLSGSRRMVLECGLIAVTSGWGLTVDADGEGSWI